jgi:hypothetical protein
VSSRNWELVRIAASSLAHGAQNIDNIPGLVARVLKEEAWREFWLPTGEHVEADTFEEFMQKPVPRGWGTTEKVLCDFVHRDTATLDLLTDVLKRPPGRPKGGAAETLSIRQGSAPAGTTEAAALRRLRKDAPQLHAEVLAGRLTAHGAMIRAGYRPRTVSVPIERPDAVARALIKHMRAEDLTTLQGLLIARDYPSNYDPDEAQ